MCPDSTGTLFTVPRVNHVATLLHDYHFIHMLHLYPHVVWSLLITCWDNQKLQFPRKKFNAMIDKIKILLLYVLKINRLLKRLCLNMMKNIRIISDDLSIGFSRIVLHAEWSGGKSGWKREQNVELWSPVTRRDGENPICQAICPVTKFKSQSTLRTGVGRYRGLKGGIKCPCREGFKVDSDNTW